MMSSKTVIITMFDLMSTHALISAHCVFYGLFTLYEVNPVEQFHKKIIIIWMKNSVDPDQPASLEAG